MLQKQTNLSPAVATEVLNTFLDEMEGGAKKILLLKVLCSLSRNNEKIVAKLEKEAINHEMNKIFNEKITGKWPNVINEANKFLVENQKRLSEIAEEKYDYNCLPVIKSDEVQGRGHTKKYWIDAHNEPTPTVHEFETENSILEDIQYLEKPIKGTFLIPEQGLDFGDNRYLLSIFSNLCPIFIFLGSIMLMLFLLPSTGYPLCLARSSIGMIFFGLILGFFLHPFYTAFKDHIALYDGILTPLKEHGVVLQYTLNNPLDKKILKDKLRLIKYVSTCPICRHEINLAKRTNNWGSFFFSTSDLIGECRGNPTQHQFSFDHTTMKGIRHSR